MPRLRIIECAPITALLLLCAVLTVAAEPVLRYTRDTARALHASSALHRCSDVGASASGPSPRRSAGKDVERPMKRLLPAPLLSAALFALWLAAQPIDERRAPAAGRDDRACDAAVDRAAAAARGSASGRPVVLLQLILAVGDDVVRSNLARGLDACCARATHAATVAFVHSAARTARRQCAGGARRHHDGRSRDGLV